VSPMMLDPKIDTASALEGGGSGSDPAIFLQLTIIFSASWRRPDAHLQSKGKTQRQGVDSEPFSGAAHPGLHLSR